LPWIAQLVVGQAVGLCEQRDREGLVVAVGRRAAFPDVLGQHRMELALGVGRLIDGSLNRATSR